MEEIRRAGPKDVFLHLLAIVALYVSGGTFLALIFQYINILIPDPLFSNQFGLDAAYRTIRWSIATLIVVFPVYILTARFLNKAYLSDSVSRNLRIRKWLLYFTLFVAAIILIGDLVTLIFNLLGGELTLRFVLKVLTVAFVAGAIFGYYLWELRRYGQE